MSIGLSAPSARRTGQNWLTRHRRSRRRRTSRLPLAARTTHLSQWSTFRASHLSEWRTHRSTNRDGRCHWSTNRNRSAHGSTDRNWSAHRHWRNHRNRPGQRHRNTSHLRDWSASRSARTRCRSCTSGPGRCRSSTGGLARRRVEACIVVAAGYQRGGRNLRAQRHCDTAQSSAGSNCCDVESIKDRHRRRTLHLRSDICIHVMQQSRMPYRSRG